MTNMLKKDKLKEIKELGQFYTSFNTVSIVMSILKNKLKENNLDLKKYFIIEPSAGDGSFLIYFDSDNLKYKAFDLYPKNDKIIKENFLTLDIEKYKLNKKDKNIIIGNPPFGKRSKLAIDFFNKSTEIADIIAFILPNQFEKYSVQSKLNKNYKLIHSEILPKDSFYTELNKKYNVNCVFQIWVNNDLDNFKKEKNLRILKKPPITHKDFEMYQYNATEQALKMLDKDFDFAVLAQGYGDYSQKIYDKKDFNTKKHRILFKAKDKKSLKNLKSLDFVAMSKRNTTVPGFRKGDIVKEYTNQFNI